MGFTDQEKQALLAVKGVGPTVIKRFEEIGISSLAQLAEHEVDDIANLVASMLRTTCWKNSPQARAAIQATIDLALANEELSESVRAHIRRVMN